MTAHRSCADPNRHYGACGSKNSGGCLDSTTAATTVVGCQRLGHPQDYAHEHPYISALCNDGYHDTCSWVAAFGKTPGFCDCECHD